VTARLALRLAGLMLAMVLAPAAHAAGSGEQRAEAPQDEAPAPPAGGGFAQPKEHPVTAELIAEHASLQPGGATRIGVHFDLQPGWHIYAQDPGDAGLPTQVVWTVPDEAKVGPLHWPPHEHFIDPGEIHTNGYEGMVVLYSNLTLSPNAQTGTNVPVHADVRWLACKDICLPGKAALDLTLMVSAGKPLHSTHAEYFDQVP
jgi:thiol:disulfide interchange protein DsbD